MQEKTVAFLSLGCRVNQAEESTYRQHTLESGWQIVDFKQTPADVYILNTCAVTLEAERQSRQMLRQAKKRNPDSQIIVTGCAGRQMERMPEVASLVDLFIPNLTKDNLVEELRYFMGETSHPQFKYHFPPVELAKTTRLNLKITDGCFESCSFCIIPSMRGTVRSLGDDDVIQRIQEAAELGYKEVILTGIHLGAYGHEKGFHGLDTLLPRINAETNIDAVRLSSIDPHEVSDAMIEVMAQSSKICPFLHLPIQSGSDRILQRMRRRDTHKEILEKIQKLKKSMPDITLSTDVIVGFPGESEEDFQQTVQLIKQAKFSKLHVFPFSVRPGTRASFMKDHIEPEEKKRRTQIVLDLGQELRTQWLSQWVGKKVKVLIETIDSNGNGKGYTSHYLRVNTSMNTKKKNIWQETLIKEIDIEKEIVLGKAL